MNLEKRISITVSRLSKKQTRSTQKHEKGTNMDFTDDEMRTIYASLRLKEAALCEVIADTKTQIETIHSLREKLEKAFRAAKEKEQVKQA